MVSENKAIERLMMNSSLSLTMNTTLASSTRRVYILFEALSMLFFSNVVDFILYLYDNEISLLITKNK